MHRNYYTFAAQVKHLNQVLSGGMIASCFTHRKNELVLEIESDDVYLLRISIDQQYPYILLYNQQNIKDPRIDFFSPVRYEKVSALTIKPFDKFIRIQTSSHLINCQFYGKSANIYLIDQDKNVIDSFKKKTLEINSPETQDKISPDSKFEDSLLHLTEQNVNMPLADFITKNIAGFDKLLAQELCFRAGVSITQTVKVIGQNEWQKIIESISEIYREIMSGHSQIYYLPGNIHTFAPLRLLHLKNVEKEQEFESVNQGWIRYIHEQKVNQGFEKKKSEILKSIKGRITYLKRTLKKVVDAEMLEQRKQEAEKKGHLLQTFAHEIARGAEKVVLKNIFSPEQEDIEIKLNPGKSIQENAQKYFEKFKNIEEQKESLSIKKDTYEFELKSGESLLSQAENATSIKDIEKLETVLIEKNILQEPKIKQPDRDNLAYSFNRVLLGKKWEIFIGKNAANNDLLTFKFARKYDLWFHAQGVPGSHVIIRKPDRNHNPPEKIIEQAAAIAAYNSDAKHSSTVPVNLTEVRYVRKPRKAAPGAVTIINEKTVFVKPMKV